MNAPASHPRASSVAARAADAPSHDAAGGADRPVVEVRWTAGDQASRLRALVEAISKGTTALPEPIVDPPGPIDWEGRGDAPSVLAARSMVAPVASAHPSDAGAARPLPLPITRPRVPVVAITSGKGGVGKTSVAVNLAIALAQSGCRSSLLDADLGLANADVLCGLVPTSRLELVVEDADAPGQSADDPLFDEPSQPRAMSQIAVRAPGGFLLVPGSVGVAQMTRLTDRQRRSLVSGLVTLESRSDLILIDTSAGLGADVVSFVGAADLTIVVATPEPTSVADAYALMKVAIMQARDSGRPDPPLVLAVNQARSRAEARRVHTRLSTVCDRFLGASLPLLGVVRHDEHARQAVRSRSPFTLSARSSPAAKDVRALAAALVARTGAERLGRVERRGLWQRLAGR